MITSLHKHTHDCCILLNSTKQLITNSLTGQIVFATRDMIKFMVLMKDTDEDLPLLETYRKKI
ncbi:hypothetical protein HDV02_000407, partial [Globomyces sp. JEL0801]